MSTLVFRTQNNGNVKNQITKSRVSREWKPVTHWIYNIWNQVNRVLVPNSDAPDRMYIIYSIFMELLCIGTGEHIIYTIYLENRKLSNWLIKVFYKMRTYCIISIDVNFGNLLKNNMSLRIMYHENFRTDVK